MENTFEVLMEGTIVGAGVDSLLEAQEVNYNSMSDDELSEAFVSISKSSIEVTKKAASILDDTEFGKVSKGFSKRFKVDPKNPRKTTIATIQNQENYMAALEKSVDQTIQKAKGAKQAKMKIAEVKYVAPEKGGYAKWVRTDKVKELSTSEVEKGFKASLKDAKKKISDMLKGIKAFDKLQEKIKNLAAKYKDMDAKYKIAEGVALVLATYSVGYGVLKSIPGLTVSSFTAVKGNLKQLYTVAKNPEKYGWSKSIIIGLLAVLTGYGMYRFGKGVTEVITNKFGKNGEQKAAQ